MSLKGSGYQFMAAVKDPDCLWGQMLPDASESVNVHHFKEFFRTMFERQEIWYKRSILKQPAPWTTDKYLRDYKFTNVYRELDRASQWLIKNVLLDHKLSLEDLVFRIIIFRFYNQPDTFDSDSVYFVKLPHYESFSPKKLWLETVMYREKVDNPWHTAYMMNLAFLAKPKDWKGKGLFKDHAYCEYAFVKIHEMIPTIVEALKICETPEGIMHVLEKMPATAGFQAHEFYIDFCYCARYWKEAIMPFDENDFTNVGPGCSLGIRLIFPQLQPNEQIDGIYHLRDMAEEQLAEFKESFKYIKWKEGEYHPAQECNITLHQIEMWLCEYQKYWKMTIQQGKQRSKFTPKTKY